MDVISVGVIGLAAALLAVQLKSVRTEYAAYVVFGAGVVIAFYTVGRLEAVVELFGRFLDELPVDAVYMASLLKMIGIAYTVQFCAGLCKDAGYGAMAGQIETFGKLTVLSLSLPLVLALLDTVRTFLYEGL
ncbi:MAG: stage III sporulation protein AD [Lachnospiraceae bacterium]|nr:stage III sporulation protein AD [Lachnospiraceae bacterium]